MRWYALAQRPWVEEDGGHWGLPPGSIGAIDLAPVSGKGHVFVTSDVPFDAADVAAAIGDGTKLDSYVPTAAEATVWQELVGVVVQPGWTLLDMLWATLTVEADPDGVTRAKPIMPTHRGVLELHLGGHSLIRAEKLPDDPTTHPAWPNIQRVLQNDFRAIQASDRTLARKWLGAQQGKYRLSPERARDLIVPADLPRELPLKPRTKIGDTFEEASDTNLADHTATGPDGGFSWSQVNGLTAVEASTDTIRSAGGTDAVGRAEFDLSSSDMEVSFESLDTTDGGAASMGALARFSESAITAYAMLHRTRTGTTYRLFRINNGSFTQIGSNISAGPVATPYRVITKIDGSQLSGLINGSVVIGPETDTNITTGLRGGLRLPNVSAWRLDNFEAADLLAETDLVRVRSEILGTDETQLRARGRTSAYDESLTVDHVVQRLRGLARRRDDTVALADMGTVARALSRLRSDTAGIVETTASAVEALAEALVRVLAETMAMAEAVARPRRLARVRAELVGMAGAVARVGGFVSAAVPIITSRIRMRARPSSRMNVPPARR